MRVFSLQQHRILTIAILCALVLAPLFLLTKTTDAAPNQQINYQGKLTNASNAAVADGTYNMKFWLLTSPTIATTSAVWAETLTGTNKVTVTNGLFSVMLGSTSPLTSIDFNQTLYLGVEIGGSTTPAWDGEMSPRKILGTVPAAFEADKLDGLNSTQFVRTDTTSTIASSSASTLLTITQNGAGDILNLFDGATEIFSVVDGGRIGIGSTSPSALLSIANTISTPADTALFTISSTTGGTATSTFLTVLASGNVGIGATAPNRLFNVVGGLAGFEVVLAELRSNGATANTGTTLKFVNSTTAGAGNGGGEIAVLRGVTSANAGDMVFRTGNSAGVITERMRISGVGNVGIGTTSPSAVLTVTNTLQSTGGTPLFIVASTTGGTATTTLFSIDVNGLATFNYGTSTGFTATNLTTTDLYTTRLTISTTTVGVLVTNSTGNVSASTTIGDSWISDSLTLTTSTGLPISTGVSGLGSNVATFLATPSSANLAAAITDETGTAGSLVFSVAPTFTGTATFANAGFTNATTSGNLSIGTSTLQSRLTVWGAGTSATTRLANFVNSASTSLLTIFEDGKVGIGSSTPIATFSVQGIAGATNPFVVSSSTNAILFTITPGGVASTTYASTTGLTAAVAHINTLRDSAGSLGTNGMVLQTNGSVSAWVSTSSLSITAALSGGTDGYLARWTSASTLSTGLFQDNGTVAGINATTSTSTFLVQGTAGVNPFTVASSTGRALLTVNQSGYLGVGTTDPVTLLSVVAPAASDSWLTLDTADNGRSSGIHFREQNGNETASFKIYYDSADLKIDRRDLTGEDVNVMFFERTNGNVGIGTIIPAATFSITGTTTVTPFLVASSTGTALFTITPGGVASTTYASTTGLTAANASIGALAGVSTFTLSTTTVGVLVTNSTGNVTASTTIGDSWISDSLTLTTSTGLPISTGVSGLGSNVATFLATPSSANLAAAVTDETGTAGSLVFSVAPTFTGTATFANAGFTNATTSGNLSIGTSTLQSRLTVWGAGTSATTRLANFVNSASTSLFTIFEDGKVGIGSSTPSALLTLANSVNTIGGMPLFTVASTTGGTATSTLFTIRADGSVGIGTSTPTSLLTMGAGTLSGARVAGMKQYFGFTNSVASAVYYGDETYIVNAPTATSTLVAKMIRIEDTSALGNTVRGFEAQAYRGTNTKGENTGLSGFGRTFGVRGTTIGDAGDTYLPAGVYAESQGTTQGNALRAYSGTITTEALAYLFHDTSVFSGTGLKMNFGNTTGSFAATSSSAKFLDLQVAGTSKFIIAANGSTTIGDGTINAGLRIPRGGICVDSDGSCISTTTGEIRSVTSVLGNSDLAEMYFSKQSLNAGEIVSLSGGLSIVRAEEGTQQNIIGVVSTKPGMTLGYDDTSLTAGEHAYPIGLKGRVPIKLSTENGPIKKGDRIALSSIPGVGMKATESSRVVGTALEDYDGTRAYTDGFFNQFGDDMVKERITTKTLIDTRTQDGCSYGGGSALGEAPCTPDKVTQTSVTNTTDNSEYRTMQNTLKNESARRTTIETGETVFVGQALMFIELTWYQVDAESLVLKELTATSTFTGTDETLWSRLKTLAQNFVDGVLSVTGIKANRVEVRDELCVDGVCVTADDLRALLKSVHTNEDTTPEPPADTTTGGSSGGSSDSATGGDAVIPPDETIPPVTETPPEEPPVTDTPPPDEPASEEPSTPATPPTTDPEQTNEPPV